MAITVKTAEEIEKMRVANHIVGYVLKEIGQYVVPGVSTWDLDKKAEEMIRSFGAVPSFKGYEGFPASICASVDDEVIHGIPSKKTILHEGSIISIDVGAYIGGYHGDGARTFPVGAISKEAQKLIDVTRNSFYEGVKFAKNGAHLHEICAGVQAEAEKYGYGIVRDYCGHGIGTRMHEDPSIPNYKPIGRGPKLCTGMCLAVEPMITMGTWEVEVLENDWTVVTRDGSLAAHHENTILITDDGYEILTQ